MTSDSMYLELVPEVERLLERHLGMAKEWFPHQSTPWSRGRDFEPDWTWSDAEFPTSRGVRSALYTNLLTEDNLPYYTLALHRCFGGVDGPWGEWSRRWTAEEDRHSTAIRDWITVNRVIDPVHLERSRMAQICTGWFPNQVDSVPAGLAYVTFQELATRVAHRNTGLAIGDPTGRAMLAQVAADENLHYLFYKDLGSAALMLDPDAMVIATSQRVRNFEMPGTGMPGFKRHAFAIATAGIFDFSIYHDHVLEPVLMRQWKFDKLEGLSPEAERARDDLFEHVESVRQAGERFVSMRGPAPVQAG
ncbi:MAG: acyl-ACP desaturase [Actinomycetota bacterium]|jgi:acyl-[acyl-carrier-protein] desaturase|nr:acyl-ACP desaturase [Actinomycetota bacterium]MDA8281024.1 acyl-ACP desaturase [Actinomycetota bacterium]